MATAGPAHRVQSAVEVYGYPQGHIGHMGPEEDTALKDFKTLLVEKGLYSLKSATDEYGTHDDATLLRFLRARRFQVQDACQQFQDTEEWRSANELDLLYRTIDVEHYDETRKLYPQWTGRRDRRGIPLYVYEVRHLNAKTMAAYEKSAGQTNSRAKTDGKTPPKLIRLFALYENLLRFVMPVCSALTDREYPATPITQSNNIVDISGVGLKQFWNLRNHMQDASTLATAHYPETLDRIFIVGAPAFFPTVWGWIKRWFDPITTSKIFIIGQSEMQSTLEKFVDPANIPKKYGGELEFEFGDLPVLDPALNGLITWEGSYTDFPRGPLYWHDRGDYIELEAVGSVAKKERAEMVCKMRKPALDHVYSEKQDGKSFTGLPQSTLIRPDMLRMPTDNDGVQLPAEDDRTPCTEPPKIPKSATEAKILDATGVVVAAEVISSGTAEPESQVVEAGKLVSASRPEPVSFVTAREDLSTASKEVNNPVEAMISLNGSTTGPHNMVTEDVLDPNSSNHKPQEETLKSAEALLVVARENQEDEKARPGTAETADRLEKMDSRGRSDTASSKNSRRSSLKKIISKIRN